MNIDEGHSEDTYNHLTCLLKAAASLTSVDNQQRQTAAHFDVSPQSVVLITKKIMTH